MFFVTTSPPQIPLGGAGASQMSPGVAFEGMQMVADGSTAADLRAAPAMGLPTTTTTTTTSAAPPSYEAIVLDPNGPRSQTNLFVRKLASAVKEKDLKTMFERYGTIMSFALMRDIHTGESLGTAFVRYRTHEEARAAMAGLDGTELYGRPISIQWAKKEHDGTPCGEARRKIHKLFARNIPLSVTARHLRQVFSQFGSINNVTLHSDTAPAVPRDAPADAQAGQMRNIAFILFQEDGAAERAVSALHNTCPFPSCEGIPLMVKLAEDNRDRLGRKQKADNNILNSVGPVPSMMIPANGQPAAMSMSTPVSATISPAQIPLDTGAAGHVLGTPMMPGGIPQGLPFSMMPNGPTAAGAPVLQATTDASGATAYMYVGAAPMSTATPSGPRIITPPASGAYFVQTPSGLQAFSAPMQAAQIPTYYAPKTGTSATAATTTSSGVTITTPSATSLESPGQPYFPGMTMSPMFVDAQGNSVTPLQQNIIMPNFYPQFASPQQLLAQQQQQQQLMMQQQTATPSQKRSSLPSFAEASGAAGGHLPMMVTPTSASFIKVNGTPLSKNASERSPAAQQLQQQLSSMRPDVSSTHSVSPQLSSAASNTNLLATDGSSVVATPMEGGMAVPPCSLVPLTTVPVGVSTGVGDVEEREEAHPFFNYDSLRMNNANNSLTAVSSSTGTNGLPVPAVHLRIEEDDVLESGLMFSSATRQQTAKQ